MLEQNLQGRKEISKVTLKSIWWNGTNAPGHQQPLCTLKTFAFPTLTKTSYNTITTQVSLPGLQLQMGKFKNPATNLSHVDHLYIFHEKTHFHGNKSKYQTRSDSSAYQLRHQCPYSKCLGSMPGVGFWVQLPATAGPGGQWWWFR